jgi:hypothetical protein
MLPLVLRSVAVLIAVAAIIDPVVLRESAADAIVAVVPGDPVQDAALTEQVLRALDGSFTAVRGAYPGAAVTVVAGGGLPRDVDLPPVPLFSVLPTEPGVTIRRIDGPASAPLSGMIEARVLLHVLEAGPLRVQLLRDGVAADAVDVADAAPGALRVVLRTAPAGVGAVRLRVEAGRGGQSVAADHVVEVVGAPWRVLFHDGRPSWMSTFVRRTLEQDPRFATSARITTSQNIATQFGTPGSLQELSAAAYHLVVIGAPELLGQADVTALERYMRTAGGAVLLLLDRAGETPYSRLAGVTQWRTAESPAAVSLLTAESRGATLESGTRTDTTALLRTLQYMHPTVLPVGARAMVLAPGGDAVVWRAAVGQGQLFVSGALDAWRYRTDELSRFGEFWPQLAAEAAAGTPPPVGLHGDRIAAPGEWVAIEVTTVTAAQVSAAVEGTHAPPLELQPVGAELHRAEFRAPTDTGEYRIVAHAGGHTATMSLVVAANRGRASSDGGLLAALAVASGGGTITEAQLPGLPRRIQEVLRDTRAPRPWHPMRSAWWLLPFTAALAGEWLWRRRRGLP